MGLRDRLGTEAARRLGALGLVAGVAAAYYVGARAGLLLALVGDQVTPLWPPTGIAVVALLLFGPRAVPGIAIGAFLVNAPIGPSLPAVLAIAAGNTLAPVATAGVLRRFGFELRLGRVRDVAVLVLAALAGMAISSSVGTAVLAAGSIDVGIVGTWLVWWAGDAMGVLVVAPALLAVRCLPKPARVSRARLIEAGWLIAGTIGVSSMITSVRLPLLYLVFPFVIWGAVRFRLAGAASTVGIASTAAILAAATGNGPFPADLSARMVTLQAFNASCALIGFLLASLTAERDRARVALEDAGTVLEDRVALRTSELSAAVDRLERSEHMLEEAQRCAHIGSWEWDIASDKVAWSDELFRLYGLTPGEIEVSFDAFLARVHPGDRDRVRAAIWSAHTAPGDFSFDHRIVWPDGSVHWLHCLGSVAVDERGDPVRMLGTGQDIDDRKRAEDASRRLQQAHARRRHALELNDEIVQGLSLAIYASDSGDLHGASRALRSTLGAARHIVAELLGSEGDELTPGDLVREQAARVPWRRTG